MAHRERSTSGHLDASPTRRAPTCSGTPTAGWSTSARRSRSASGSPRTGPAAAPADRGDDGGRARSSSGSWRRTEVDALMLEYNLIKSHRPRFNVRYRDDKSYPYLALTVGETWPRARVMRGPKRKGVRYFGPYGHAYAIRETLDALTRVFPVRTCSNAFFDQRAPGPAGRACTTTSGAAPGPCVPEIDRRHRGELPRAGRRAGRLPGRRTTGRCCTGWSARCARRPSAWSTNAPRSSATSSPPRARRSRARRWCSPATRTST